MDPLGFGLENFDAIGAWRTQDGKFADRCRRARCPTAAVQRAAGAGERCCAQDRDAFARAVTAKLLTYALGRGLERYDRRDGRTRSRSGVAASDYRFSALVLEIVKSLPFQRRQRSGRRR